ncbi:MAG: YkvA family protein [Cyclobacteriaceae bacterium]|nr:YkvA family protein [Cyclobacteriaceae bacterium]
MDPVNSTFFKKAMDSASEILKNKSRLTMLIANAYGKMKNINMTRATVGFKEKVGVLGRMIKAYANGTYRLVPWKSVLLMTGAIVYFVTPLDLIPDFIPVSGLLDDFTVIVWVYHAVRKDIEDFELWEKGQDKLPRA